MTPAHRLSLRAVAPVVTTVLIITLLAVVPASAQSGLVAAYAFSEGSGATVADASGNNNIGTVSAATWTTQGRFGNALVFNGTNGVVTVSSTPSLNLTTGMTLEAWVYPTIAQSGWRAILQKQTDAFFLHAGSTSPGSAPALGATIAGSCCPAVFGQTALPVNTWSHVAGTYDGSQLRLYINGALVSSTPASGNLEVNTNALRIGGNTYGGEFFTGRIDEVRIYNRALSPAEILTDMNAPIAPAAPDTTAPTAPTNLAAVATSTSQINLTWTASTDNVAVTGYQIERCAGAGCSAFAQVGTAGGTIYTDTGLTASTTYGYRARATDAAGNLSSYSNAVFATTPALDTTPPTAPTNLGAVAVSSSQVNLTWTAATDNVGVTGYRVERCQGAGCTTFTQIATPAGTSYNNTGLAAGTSYSYRVRATDAAGNLGGYSSVATASTLDTTAPTAPTNLTPVVVSNSQINLTWTASTDNVGVTGYRVLRCQGAGCTTFTQVGTAGGTTYNDIGLAGSTTYRYRVRATDAAGNVSGNSNTVSATTQATLDTTPPTAPTNLGAVATSSSQINLTWTAATDNVAVTGYRVERCQGAGCSTFTQIATPAGTSYNNTGLAAGTSYSYRVRATDAAGNLGGYSNVATASTLDTTAPTAPTNLTPVVVSSNQINLTWTASTDNVGVTGYRVERCQGTGCTTFAQVGTAASTTYSDLGLTASTTYVYRVRATDAAGNVSGTSNAVSATTLAVPDTIPPSAPTTLAAGAVSSVQINLTWTASTDNVAVTGYQVERCDGPACSTFTQIATLASTSYSNIGLAPGSSYSYRVRATDAAGNLSAYSNVASATTLAPDTTPPTAPTILAGVAASNSQINLTWTASTDDVAVTGYQVERCQGTGCSAFTQIATPASTSYSNTGLAAGASYSYRVRATDAAGNLSGYSNVASATTLNSPPGLVAAYGFNEGAGSTVTDASGNNNAGVLSGATWTAQGRFGGALVFNGINSVVTVSSAPSLNLTTGMTLEAWVYPTATLSNWKAILQKQTDAYYLTASSSLNTPASGGTLNGSCCPTVYGPSALPVNTWTHVASTYDGSQLRLYINGALVSSTAASGSLEVNTNALRIGGNTYGGEFFTGRIDEVRIYSRALSQAELQTDMATGVGGGGGGPDVTAPTIAITAPTGGATYTSSTSSLTLSGTAADNVAVTQVSWTNDRGGFGFASGTTAWSAPDIALQPGLNVLTVTAFDAGGNTGAAALTVDYTGNETGPAAIGQWANYVNWPLVAIHMMLLRNGQILIMDDNTDPTAHRTFVWSSTTESFVAEAPHSGTNLFCAGHAALPDGRMLVIGGHAYSYGGIPDTTVFDPSTLTWSAGARMTVARWYPTATGLPDGRVLATSGSISCPTCIAEIPETYDPTANVWTPVTGAALSLPLYPHMFVLPDGRVIATSNAEDPIATYVLDLTTRQWSTVDPAVLDGGSAAMYVPGKIMKSGTARNPDYSPGNAARTTYVLDMTQPSPHWRQTASMAFPRTQHNLTLLPDGTVLVTGGATNSDVNDVDAAVLEAELWSPITETWTTMARMARPRLYHSTALLLPDARVLIAGGGRFGVDELTSQIYSPPYLFKGARPVVSSAPTLIPYGTQFFVGTPDAARIASVSLIRLGSVTHAFNQDQRFLNLGFLQSGGGLTIDAPANGNLAPPGYYMLFVLDGNGVPSVARILKVQ